VVPRRHADRVRAPRRGRGQLVVRVVGSGAETIVTPASASDAEPVFSHDGTWIAVIRTTGRASELVAIPWLAAMP